MAANTTSAVEAVKQLTYLAGALKAPRITEAHGTLEPRTGGPVFERRIGRIFERRRH